MFKKVIKKVKSGDQFIELGKTNVIWEVVGIIDNPNIPPHARIKKLGVDSIHLTSVSALLDKALFEPKINGHLETKSVTPPINHNNANKIT